MDRCGRYGTYPEKVPVTIARKRKLYGKYGEVNMDRKRKVYGKIWGRKQGQEEIGIEKYGDINMDRKRKLCTGMLN